MERGSQKDSLDSGGKATKWQPLSKEALPQSNSIALNNVNSGSRGGASSIYTRSSPESWKSARSNRTKSSKLRILQQYFTFRQRGIALNLVLFATITCAQFGAALVADSLSLLGDSGSMAVDTLSYAAGLWAECNDSENQQRNQLVASALSILILLAITCVVLYHSGLILFADQEDDDDVNYYIVFGFAIGGLIFDFIGLYALVQGKKEKSTNAGDLNLHAAGMHVIADFMRSTTTLVESILIWVFGFDSTITDAWAALIVSALIILPCMEMIRECLLEYIDYRNCKKDTLKLLEDKSKNTSQSVNSVKKDYHTIYV